MSDDVIAHMRARIDQCRRLADMISNEEARRILLQMAEDGEADIQRLGAEQQAQQPPPRPE